MDHCLCQGLCGSEVTRADAQLETQAPAARPVHKGFSLRPLTGQGLTEASSSVPAFSPTIIAQHRLLYAFSFP